MSGRGRRGGTGENASCIGHGIGDSTSRGGFVAPLYASPLALDHHPGVSGVQVEWISLRRRKSRSK